MNMILIVLDVLYFISLTNIMKRARLIVQLKTYEENPNYRNILQDKHGLSVGYRNIREVAIGNNRSRLFVWSLINIICLILILLIMRITAR